MDILFNPLFVFWLLAVLSFIALKFKLRIWKLLLSLAFTELFLFTVTPLPVLMVRHLEGQYSPFDERKAGSYPVLVLGGNHAVNYSLPPLQRLSDHVLGRVTEGVRIYSTNKKNTFICSGFSFSDTITTAQVMAETAVSLGVSPKDTLMLIKPRTTWEEAHAFKERLGDRQFILVTSALHMPRAMETFKRMGLRPIAAPANFLSKEDPERHTISWWPSGKKALFTEKALHEYAGLWYYRWFKES